MRNRLTEPIYMESVTVKEINRLISALKDTAIGFDYMNSMSLKISFEILVKPLTNICNLFPTQGIFLSQLKIANVIPLYKVKTSCCLIITDLFLYCVFFQRLLKNDV